LTARPNDLAAQAGKQFQKILTPMLHSPALQKNPDLFVFLPIFYMVWSDAILTPTEVSTMQALINGQDWLTSEERTFLLSYLNPSAPPTTDELKDWYAEIRTVTDAMTSENAGSLIDIGTTLAQRHGGTLKAFTTAQDHLAKMEETLGMISRESAYNFSPSNRTTITGQQATKKTFDVETLAALLDGDQADMIRKVKTLLSDPAFRYLNTDNLSEYREKVLFWCRLLADRGFGSMAYPAAFGGQGDMAKYFAIMETLSYHDLSLVIKFGVQFGLFGMSVFLLGTERHHRQYLVSIGTLQLPGCFAMTETGHGSNVRGIETTATYDHERKIFILHTPGVHAQKEFIGNAAVHGQAGTVFAKLILEGKDYGVTAFVVPLRDDNGRTLPGITIEDCGRKMGLNGVDNGKIRFDNVIVPVENMLDRFARVTAEGKFESPIASDNRRFFTMLGTLVGGRIGIPRAGLSATKSGLTIAIRYGDGRKQFGPDGGTEVPILNYRTHQRRLMPLVANAYALHFALQYLTKRFISRREEEMQEIEALAAGLKSFTTWNATASLQECRECCGGKGYLSENRIGALKNDTEIFTTFEGDNTVLMQLVAKSRLTEFRHEFGHMSLMGMLNYVAGQAKTSVAERNPIIVRSTDEKHLMDPEFHLNAFKYRERDILTSAAKRLKRHIDDGMDSFDAFNVSQHHLVQVAFAYVERIVLEQFLLAIEQVRDAGCKTVLQKLGALFALSQIEKNRGWYLEQGYLEGVKTKAIRKLVNQLCWEIRQDAVPLVDAFGIPDPLLGAPIAQ
jgi:acyl-CoA oxidase